jgi:hypothetical protein
MKKCWKFAMDYYLDDSKPINDRTNGQKRGLGGIFDSFLNKIIEIAVCKKLHEINSKKQFKTDFEIHPLTKKKTEPDIIKIIEKKRTDQNPKLYVEIKNLGETDDWFGPKTSELKSIKTNVYGIKDLKKIYYIYCQIKDQKGQSRESSPLGTWLKHIVKKDAGLEKFHNVKDLFVEFSYVFTASDIDRYGTVLKEGTPMPDTDVFPSVSERTKGTILKKIQNNELEKIKLKHNVLPKLTASRQAETEWLSYPESLGNFTFTGKLQAFKVELKTVRNIWIKCITDVIVRNDVLGDPVGSFKKDQIVLFRLKQKGEIYKKNSTDRFVARCNKQKIEHFHPNRITEIAQNI